ncbi:MAG: type I pantothenate kinase [Acidimicrobiia bacterium]
MTDAPAALVDLARARVRADGTPVVVGIAGAVASGKSTLAADVARAASERGTPADVVGTDGFLYPNSVLSERALLARKGFPESYDVGALRAFVDTVHSGADEVIVPRYSHVIYDVTPGEPLALGNEAVIVVEGLNALGALADRLDLAVYLQAEEADLERWYVARFLELRAEAETDPRSFYRQFLAMSVEATEALARQTWREVNLVNLREHIAPTLELADCVVVKGPDHAVTAVETREHRRATGSD